MIKSIIKKIIPPFVISWYHRTLAVLAMYLYGRPSEEIIVIGVTGTNGKSTVVNLIAKILEESGCKVGLTSTVNFKVAGKTWLNSKKMTMLGRFQLQKLLKKMVKAGCKYAVIETSSEGIKQHRHLGINYDVAVFTNLTPEHIESHGSFDKYKKAKAKLFEHLSKSKNKVIRGHRIPKAIVANLDDQHSSYFLSFSAERKLGFTVQGKENQAAKTVVAASNIQLSESGANFQALGQEIHLNMLGDFSVENALAAVAVGWHFKIDVREMKQAMESIKYIPGRMQLINQGQNFKVMVDYAPEPNSLKRLYKNLNLVPHHRLIHVLGSCGGGRDKARRPVLGRMAAEKADLVIVTNEDPYDDDPMGIINEVAAGAEEKGKQEGVNLFKILDRREALRKAVFLAQEGDLVLVTGKGAEQAICAARGKKIPWDDRKVLKEVLK